MASYTIGEMIQDMRKAGEYTQEILCERICSVSSLCRIEHSGQMPTKKVFERLMQKLGVPLAICSTCIGKREVELYRLTHSMTGGAAYFTFRKMGQAIQEIEGKMELNQTAQSIEKQYLLFMKACYSRHISGNRNKEQELLKEAILITMPKFSEHRPFGRRNVLTFDEIDILKALAENYYDSEKKEEGIQLLLALKEYLEEHIIDVEEKAKRYPSLIYQLSSKKGRELGQHREAMRLCEQGIDSCVEYGKLAILPYLLYTKACAAAEIKELEEAEELFRKAEQLFRICRQEQLAERIRNEAAYRYKIFAGEK